jgi:hypothetical protein
MALADAPSEARNRFDRLFARTMRQDKSARTALQNTFRTNAQRATCKEWLCPAAVAR